MAIYLHVVYGCFAAKKAELGICKRDIWLLKYLLSDPFHTEKDY
jgi:hypothetical protein